MRLASDKYQPAQCFSPYQTSVGACIKYQSDNEPRVTLNANILLWQPFLTRRAPAPPQRLISKPFQQILLTVACMIELPGVISTDVNIKGSHANVQRLRQCQLHNLPQAQ